MRYICGEKYDDYYGFSWDWPDDYEPCEEVDEYEPDNEY